MHKKVNEFLELYDDGLTHQEIGKRYNISRQEVWKVLSSCPDYKPRPTGTRKNTSRNQKIISTYIEQPELRVVQIAELFGVGEATVYRVIKGKARRHKLREKL